MCPFIYHGGRGPRRAVRRSASSTAPRSAARPMNGISGTAKLRLWWRRMRDVLVRQRIARIAAVAVAALALGSCRPTGATPKFVGDFRGAPSEVDPAFAEDWDALQRAIAVDPGSADVAAAADRLLARGPALDLRLWAIAAKAEHAYRGGDDAKAID